MRVITCVYYKFFVTHKPLIFFFLHLKSSFGAYFIPSMFQVGMQYESANLVLYGLAAFYFFCGCLNYYYYVRIGAERPGV